MQKQLRFACTLLACLLTAACAYNQIQPRTDLSDFPIKIGIIADSQITTNKERYETWSFRSPLADRISHVSIRPPALEYLAPDMLDYLLDALKSEKVDLILYLGDAANSGCRDELDIVFSRLRAIATGDQPTPTYFVIGNHDYLGTGNQTLRSARADLCENGEASNPAVDKYQLIEWANALNSASAEIDPNFEYASLPVMPSAPDPGGHCDDSHYFSSNAAILKPRFGSGLSVDILLADTSDYNNVWFRPKLSAQGKCNAMELWGLKGSMSYQQIKNLQLLGCQQGADCNIEDSLREGTNPQFGVDYRFVASHYDPKSFNAATPWNWSPSFVRDNLGYLLSDGENIWLGAHHHSKTPYTSEYPVGKSVFPGPSGSFAALSVGSTTDHHPHAAIIERRTGNNRRLTEKLGYRAVFVEADTSYCEEIFSFAEESANQFQPVCNAFFSDVQSMLGVNKIYAQKDCWNADTMTTVRNNLDKLIGAPDLPSAEKTRICLAMKASEIESSSN